MKHYIVSRNCDDTMSNTIDDFKKDADEIRGILGKWKQDETYKKIDEKDKSKALQYVESIIDKLKVDSRALGTNNSLFEQMQRSVDDISKFTTNFAVMITSIQKGNKELTKEVDKIEEIISNNNNQDISGKLQDLNNIVDRLSNRVESSKNVTQQRIEEVRKLFDSGPIGAQIAIIRKKIENFPTQDDLNNLVKKSDLGGFAKTTDLSDLAKDQDLKSLDGKVDDLLTKGKNLEGIDKKIDNLVKKADLGIESESVDLKKLAKKADLSKLKQEVTDFAQQDKAFDKTITQEIKTISQGMNIIPDEVQVELIKSNEITGKYEAEIKLTNSNTKIGTFSSVGYYFYDSKVYIYDHFKPEINVDLPPQFHFLKVVKTEEDEYKLAFCNSNGHEYYGLLDGLKLISPWNLKSIKNIDFAEYYNKNGSYPSFIAKASNDSYSHSQQHGVDVYKIGNGEKKVGSLVDEFGYYDTQNKLHYTNYQMGTQNHSYDPPSFTITKGDNQCQLHKMKIGSSDHRFLNDTMDCSLVEYVANYVNNEYFNY